MRITLLVAGLVIALAIAVVARAEEAKSFKDKIYGTPGSTTICVIVTPAFDEAGTHYIPVGTKFGDFFKSLHPTPFVTKQFSPAFHIRRNGKKVCDTRQPPERKAWWENFQLEDGDEIRYSINNW